MKSCIWHIVIAFFIGIIICKCALSFIQHIPNNVFKDRDRLKNYCLLKIAKSKKDISVHLKKITDSKHCNLLNIVIVIFILGITFLASTGGKDLPSAYWAIVGVFVSSSLGYLIHQQKEAEKQKERERSIAMAFYGEIHSLLKLAETREYIEIIYRECKQIEKTKAYPLLDKFLDIQFTDYFTVYRTNVNNIGALNSDIIPLITEFYIKLFSIMEDMTMIPGSLLKKARFMCDDEENVQSQYVNHLQVALAQNLLLFLQVITIGKQICEKLSSTYKFPCDPVFTHVKSYDDYLADKKSEIFIPEYRNFLNEHGY